MVHDKDPVPSEVDESSPPSVRELLARVDERSMAIHRSLVELRLQVRSLTEDYHRDNILVRDRFERLEATMQQAFEKAQQNADQSGEWVEQELTVMREEVVNLRGQLAQKEKDFLQAQLDAEVTARKGREEVERREIEDTRKRRKDLVWSLVKASILAAAAFIVSHVVWH